MSEQASTSVSVNQIDSNEKRALEGLLGTSLSQGQHVLIMAYMPAVSPTADQKAKAKEELDFILAKAHQNIKAQGVPDEELDAAIDEAVNTVRRGKCDS